MAALLLLFNVGMHRSYGAVHADTPVKDYAVYTFSNASDNRLMQVAGNIYYNEKYADGAKIIQRKKTVTDGNTNAWQRWHIIYKCTEDGIKYYYIRNVFSGKFLTASDNQPKAGAQLWQYYKQNKQKEDEQLWSFRHIGSTQHFLIVNKANRMAVAGAPGISGDSIPVVQEPVDKSARQLWTLTLQPDDTYRDDDVVRFFNRNNSDQGSVAFDEGVSIPLYWGANKGKALWVTQDAWDGIALQPNKKFKCTDFFQYRNSMLIQPSLTDWNPDNTKNITKDGSAQNRPKQICDIVPHTEFAWPAAGVEIGNHVYMQCGEGDGLTVKGQSLYDLTESAGSKWDVKRTVPDGLRIYAGVNYAAGMVKADDGYVYVFGTKGIVSGYGTNVYVARFPVRDPQAWTFWNGASWTANPITGDTAKIASGLGTATVSFVHGKYVLITMDQGFNCDSPRNIYAAVSDKPAGPFTQREKVYSISEYLYGSYARYYTPSIHPEFDNGRNELLVTYCLNFSACGVSECKDGYQDPYFYRVKGIRIPYAKIGL